MSNITSKLVNSVRQAKQQKTQITDTADTNTQKLVQSTEQSKVNPRTNSNEEKAHTHSTLISNDKGISEQQSFNERVWPD